MTNTGRRKLLKGIAAMSAVLAGAGPLPEPIEPPRSFPAPRKRAQEPLQGPWYVETRSDGIQVIRAPLHPGQVAGMESDARLTAMISGTQSGKTSAGPLWLEREIRMNGPGDYLAVTATYPLLKRKMLPEFLRLFQTTLNLGRWQERDKMFIYHDGQTRVMFGSAMQPESLESASAKAAWLDEAGQHQFRLEALEAIDRRLSLYQGRIFISTTPYNLGWLKTHVYDKARAGDPDIRVVQFPSILNPAFPREEMDRVRNTLPPWKLRMMYEGRFDKPPGLIYQAYDDAYWRGPLTSLGSVYRPEMTQLTSSELGGHLIKPFPIPTWWPRYLGLDFGGVNLARIFLAHDPVQDIFYVYQETLSGGITAAQHTNQIFKALDRAPLYHAWGGAKSEQNWRDEFIGAGLMVEEPLVKDIEVGIDRTIGLFQQKRLFVFDYCLGLRAELGAYSRETGPEGDPLEKIVDQNLFHRLDALRYVCLGVGGPPEPIPVLAMRGSRGWNPRY